MKILLLEHPRSFNPGRCNDIANTPLASCLLSGYVAGLLDCQGHEVLIVEGYLDQLSYQEISMIISDFRPDILGVHMVYHWQDDHALYAFLQQIKADVAAPYITAFGFYPTIAWEDLLEKCLAMDSVIVGEPEVTFAELTEAVACGVYPDNLPGLAVRNRVSCQRRAVIADLNTLPFPIRTEALYRLGEVNVLGSRGCYGGCTFCYINPFYGQGSLWRGRSPENIMAEIDGIMAERGIQNVYFTDPNFFGPGQRGQDRALQLAGLFKMRNIHFGIEARVNDIHDRTMEALADAGLRHILIGLESGKDSSLQRMKKLTTVKQNEEAIKILRKHGIEPNIGFIMFEPDSSLDDLRTNFEFLQRNDLLKNLSVTANVLYHNQIVLKGTPAYRELQSAGRLHVQPASTYEGVPSFENSQVAVLAELMREMTNNIFIGMNDIWSGRTTQDDRISKALNRLLIKTFDDHLQYLEAGRLIPKEQIAFFADDFGKKVHSILTTV